jgi:hypothetical protein
MICAFDYLLEIYDYLMSDDVWHRVKSLDDISEHMYEEHM